MGVWLLQLLLAASPPDEIPPPTIVGFPEIADGFEHVLVGESEPAAGARARGVWTWNADGVAMTKPPEFGDGYWFAARAAASVGDGAVRARIRFGERPNMALMFRCRLPDGDLERLSGYGLAIRRGNIHFVRWEKGLSRAVGTGMGAPVLKGRAGVEVLVMLTGPLMAVLIFDIDTLEPLATLTANDARFSMGAVGVRASKRQDRRTRITHLAVLHGADKGYDHGPANTMYKGGRIARFASDVAAALPEDLAARIVDRTSSEIIMHVKPLHIARLRRAGLEPTSISDQVPWMYLDPDYLRAHERGAVASEGGLVIDGSYKDAHMVEALLKAFHRRFPALTHLEALGQTAAGQTLWALKISDNASRSEPEPAVMLNAAHHGDELLPTEYILDAAQVLLEGYDSRAEVRRWVDNLEIWLVPLVNPSGRDVFMKRSVLGGRKNARDLDGDGVIAAREGVDVNRNYPFRWASLGEVGSRGAWPEHSQYRGEAAASEPETQAMMKLARREHFVASISYHTNGTTVMPPYASAGVENPVLDEAWEVAEAVAAAAPRQFSRRRFKVRRRLYPVDGVEKDWLRFEFGTVALVIEGNGNNPKDSQRRKRSVALNRPTWQALFDRLLNGPAIWGVVRDPTGRPLVAEVEIEEIGLRNGERWMSRGRDGLYARFLPDSGGYHLLVTADGYEPQRRAVRILGAEKLDIVMRPEPVPEHDVAHH